MDSSEAAKETSGILRGLVKEGVEKADPFQAQAIEQLNERFGLLKPIVNSLKKPQTPALGGVGDIAAGLAGLVYGDSSDDKVKNAITAMALKRMLLPRANAAGAITLDKISKGLLKSNNLTNILPTARIAAGLLKREEKRKD